MKAATTLLVVVGALATAWLAQAACPNLCSGHGDCKSGPLLTCSCWAGWGGGDCSLRLCPTGRSWADEATAVDVAHNTAVCSGRGICDYATGTCQCQPGFEGKACQRSLCPNTCNHVGVCRSMKRSAEAQFNAVTAYKYNTVWDAEMNYGCDCDIGWEGYDCSLRQCPRGDDPMTRLDINGNLQVNEQQIVLCVATSGSFTLTLDGIESETIPVSANQNAVKVALESTWGPGAVTIRFLKMGQATVCDDQGGVMQIDFETRFGDVPAVTVARDYTLRLSGGTPGTTIVVRDGTSVNNQLVHLGVTYTARQGTKEWDYCSGRGLCDQTKGECICFPEYGTSDGYGHPGRYGDCGFAMTPVTACPGVTECSGHGLCADHPTFKCTCEKGWQGGDCSQRTCPFGAAWFDDPTADNTAHASAECSNRGICNRINGECQCMPGYTGTACERIVCPGTNHDCSGHGQCMPMAQLAEIANVNGDAGGFTYGKVPHDPYRWDYNKMYGCHCDLGWHGFDCSLRDCPTGDDPHTPGNSEMQVIRCTATGGSVYLSFRQAVTAAIRFDATSTQLETALEDLDTIGNVVVTYTNNANGLCGAGNVVTVEFRSEFGDLPAIKIEDTSGLTGGANAISVAQDGTVLGGISSIKGTKENAVCSNRGICNEATGVCKCYTQFGASDGYNGPGDRGDCGYVLPIIPVDEQQRQLELFLARERQTGPQATTDLGELNF